MDVDASAIVTPNLSNVTFDLGLRSAKLLYSALLQTRNKSCFKIYSIPISTLISF